MREISCDERGFRVFAFVSSVSLLCFSAYSDDSSTPKNGTETATHGSRKGSKITLIFLALVAVALLSFSLFRFWQKKKREEQYARLLRLFEEDDELELELGLRD